MSDLSTQRKRYICSDFYQSELGRGKSFQNLIDDPIGEKRRQTQLHLTETQKKMLNSRVQTHARAPTHAHLPDLINNVHSRLLQEGLGHKAFGDDHLG